MSTKEKEAAKVPEVIKNNAAAVPEVIKAPGDNLPADLRGSWGAAKNISTENIVIPKIFHQQQLSEIVKKEIGVVAGDFCNSIDNSILAKRDEGLSIIIFNVFMNVLVKKLNGLKWEWIRTEPVNDHNTKPPYTRDTPEGKISHSLQYNFMCLIPGRLKGLPFVLSMSSTKTAAARLLCTMIATLDLDNLPSAAFVFELKNVKEKKDNNEWYGLEVSKGRDTTEEELRKAFEWFNKTKDFTGFTVDDADEKEVEGVVVKSTNTSSSAGPRTDEDESMNAYGSKVNPPKF